MGPLVYIMTRGPCPVIPSPHYSKETNLKILKFLLMKVFPVRQTQKPSNQGVAGLQRIFHGNTYNVVFYPKGLVGEKCMNMEPISNPNYILEFPPYYSGDLDLDHDLRSHFGQSS